MTEITAADVAGLEPQPFQRFVLDVLAVSLPGARIEPVDLPYGRNDGGYDGRVTSGSVDGVDAPMRVECKRVTSFTAARRELTDFLEPYDDRPVLFVVAVALQVTQRDALKALGAASDVQVVVWDGAELAQAARNAPWIARWYFRAGDASRVLWPLSEVPPGRGVAGTLLPSEEAARDRIIEVHRADPTGPVVVLGDAARVRPWLVVHEAARAYGKGAWVVGEAGAALVRSVREDLGGHGGQVPLLCEAPVGVALLAVAGVPLVIVDRPEARADWERRRRPDGTVPTIVEVARPTSDELRTWAQGLGVEDPNHAAMWMIKPELIENTAAGRSDFATFTQAVWDQTPRPALWAAVGVALGAVPSSVADVGAASAAGLIGPTDRGALRPGSPWIALGVLEAARLNDGTTLEAHLGRLDPWDAAEAVWRVVGGADSAALPSDGVTWWRGRAARLLDQVPEAARLERALRSGDWDPVFGAAERHARWLLEQARKHVASPGTVVEGSALLRRAVAAAMSWSDVLEDAVIAWVEAVERHLSPASVAAGRCCRQHSTRGRSMWGRGSGGREPVRLPPPLRACRHRPRRGAVLGVTFGRRERALRGRHQIEHADGFVQAVAQPTADLLEDTRLGELGQCPVDGTRGPTGDRDGGLGGEEGCGGEALEQRPQGGISAGVSEGGGDLFPP